MKHKVMTVRKGLAPRISRSITKYHDLRDHSLLGGYARSRHGSVVGLLGAFRDVGPRVEGVHVVVPPPGNLEG